MSDLAERVRRLVVNQLGIEEERVTEDARFMDDLGADSLDVVELVIAVEDEFDCEIPDEAVSKLGTVQGVVDFLEDLRRSAAGLGQARRTAVATRS